MFIKWESMIFKNHFRKWGKCRYEKCRYENVDMKNKTDILMNGRDWVQTLNFFSI